MKTKGFNLAFTLAEVMIVLVIIGILGAVLLPSMNKTKPDENIIKFKSANETLYRAIYELVSSGKYYLGGNMMKLPNGSDATDVSYFCNAFSEIISIKSNICTNIPAANSAYYTTYSLQDQLAAVNSKGDAWLEYMKNNFDYVCKIAAPTFGNEIVMQDGASIYEANPNIPFGSKCIVNGSGACASIDNTNGTRHRFNFYVEAGMQGFDAENIFNIICIDVDSVPNNATGSDCVNECPFGYGIRYDGKILTGARADLWIEKSVRENK